MKLSEWFLLLAAKIPKMCSTRRVSLSKTTLSSSSGQTLKRKNKIEFLAFLISLWFGIVIGRNLDIGRLLISKHSCTNFLFEEQTWKCSYFFIVQSFAFILPDIRPGGNPNLGAKNSVTLSHSWSNNKFLNNVLKIEVLKGFLRLFIW
jgi:hypothetical protein